MTFPQVQGVSEQPVAMGNPGNVGFVSPRTQRLKDELRLVASDENPNGNERAIQRVEHDLRESRFVDELVAKGQREEAAKRQELAKTLAAGVQN